MALADLVFSATALAASAAGTLSRKRPVQVGSITLDVSLIEEHSVEIELTDHPVEKGADITDHKRRKPVALRLTGVISNTPLELLGGGLDAGNRAEAAWSTLETLQAGAELITVVTTLKTYENMQIVTMRAPRDVKRGNVLEVTLEFRELIQVESETVATQAATGPKKLGRKPTPPAPEPVRQSLFSKLGSFLGG